MVWTSKYRELRHTDQNFLITYMVTSLELVVLIIMVKQLFTKLCSAQKNLITASAHCHKHLWL